MQTKASTTLERDTRGDPRAWFLAVIVCGWSLGACSSELAAPPETPCECHDGDPCTDDFCQADGTCLFVPTEAERACLDDRHCDNPTSCVTGQCIPFMGCGFSRCTGERRVCDDDDPCTIDQCIDGVGCVFESIRKHGACSSAADCDDGDACTDDSCADFAGCGLFCKHTANNCMPCTTASDCGAPCKRSTCVDGACVYEPADRFCDYQCFAPGSASPDIDSTFMTFRGLAAPVDEHCSGCACERDLVVRGKVRAIALQAHDPNGGPPWGTCAVDRCGGETTCTPLRVGRGYMVTGGNLQSQGIVNGVPRGPYILRVDHSCIAVHSDLMLGPWRMRLEVDGTTTTFDAVVLAADEGPTQFTIAGTEDGVGIPAQTLRLPNGAFRLDTSLETGRGTFTGSLFSNPDAIRGDLLGPNGEPAVLHIELP